MYKSDVEKQECYQIPGWGLFLGYQGISWLRNRDHLVKQNSVTFKIEYHAVGDTCWQPLLSYGQSCTALQIGSFIY